MKICSTNDVLLDLLNVNKAIDTLFKKTNENQGYSDELDLLVEYEDSADGRLFKNELSKILEHLFELQQDINYLQLPIIENGFLRLNDIQRYEMINSEGQYITEFYSGRVIEALDRKSVV